MSFTKGVVTLPEESYILITIQGVTVQNVLVSENETCKIGDFRLCRKLTNGEYKVAEVCAFCSYSYHK